MRILVLGGTIFLGRHLVEAALARGHTLTLFNRGQHHPELFPEAEKLRGDRDGELDALRGRAWDAVIDTCGYVPRVVRQSAELLAEAADNYVFISSISVYADASQPGIHEDSLLAGPEFGTEEITGESFGPLKVACEQVVGEVMGDRSLIIRPGLIVGPNDPTDRFTYWPARLARGGRVLAPAPKEAPVQFIDVRDLAEWTIGLVEKVTTGVLNATGPEAPLTMGGMLAGCRRAVGSEAKIRWAAPEALLAAGVQPWIDLPLWLADDGDAGLLATDIGRALATGLVFRPLDETARDTLAWAKTRPDDHLWRAGLSAEREAALLEQLEEAG